MTDNGRTRTENYNNFIEGLYKIGASKEGGFYWFYYSKIGFVFKHLRSPYKSVATIEFEMHVDRDFRGRGLGGRYIDKIVKLAEKHNINLVGVIYPDYDCVDGDKRTTFKKQLESFYRKHGFKVCKDNSIYTKFKSDY